VGKKIRDIKKMLNLINDLRNKPIPIYGKINNPGIKLHIGPGSINLQGWINIDAASGPHIHMISNGLQLDEFTDKSCSHIYACHILEHISHREISSVLKTLYRKLKPGGSLLISVPSFDAILKNYADNNRDINKILPILMGGQEDSLNYHKSIYNEASLRTALRESGFKKICEWDTIEKFGMDIGDYSSRQLFGKGSEYKLSINLEGTRIS
jgi:predicted SAM-dependent methyltransferase